MAGLSAQQVADLVPCPPEQVRRLDELGLLDAHREDGQFAFGRLRRSPDGRLRRGRCPARRRRPSGGRRQAHVSDLPARAGRARRDLRRARRAARPPAGAARRSAGSSGFRRPRATGSGTRTRRCSRSSSRRSTSPTRKSSPNSPGSTGGASSGSSPPASSSSTGPCASGSRATTSARGDEQRHVPEGERIHHARGVDRALAAAAPPRARPVRIPRRRDRGDHGTARDQSHAVQAAAGDRLPRPDRLHSAREERGTRLRLISPPRSRASSTGRRRSTAAL